MYLVHFSQKYVRLQYAFLLEFYNYAKIFKINIKTLRLLPSRQYFITSLIIRFAIVHRRIIQFEAALIRFVVVLTV